VQRVLGQGPALGQDGAIIGASFKMMVPFIVILPGLLGWPCCRSIWWGRPGRGHGGHSYNEVLP